MATQYEQEGMTPGLAREVVSLADTPAHSDAVPKAYTRLCDLAGLACWVGMVREARFMLGEKP